MTLAGRGVEVEQQQLPAPAHARERPAVDGVQRRIERLEHVQARRGGRLEHEAGERLAEAAGGDLHLGQLRHRYDISLVPGLAWIQA